MKSTIKTLNKQIKSYSYNKVYNTLLLMNVEISFENLTKLFPNVDSINLHSFLVYCLSKKATPKIYIAICENYLYVVPRIEDVYAPIYYYMSQAMKLFPNDKIIADWVITTFSGDPSSPFSDNELNNIRDSLTEEPIRGRFSD